MGNLCSRSPESTVQSTNSETSKLLRLNHFKFISTIGKGSFAKVVLVERKTTKDLFAIKLIPKSYLQDIKKLEYICNERSILIDFQNPYIVKLHHIFESQNFLCFVLDFMQGGNLTHHLSLSSFDDPVKKQFIAAEVLSALKLLHGQGKIYRDLKPDNILIDSTGHIKLADFNLSVNAKDQHDSLAGTPDYAAPEVFMGETQGVEVDFWSFGVLLFHMICGSLPFHSENRYELTSNVLELKYEFNYRFSEESKDLIKRLLVVNPDKRLASYKDIQKHKFFKGIDWELAEQRKLKSPIILVFNRPTDLRYFDKKRYSTLVINEAELHTLQSELSYNDEMSK